MTRHSIIIDCDPGIDDALALLLALASPEQIEVLGLTTVAGNKPLPVTTANARRVLDLLPRPDIAVCPGCAHPLMSAEEPDSDFHGQDGLGDIGLPQPSMAADARHAVDFLVDSVMARPAHSVTLCAVGPLTNVALAVLKEPRLPERLKALLIMGGAVWDPPDPSRPPEYNFRSDPQAAHVVLSSGARIALFGLNLTRQAPIAGAVRAALAGAEGAMPAVLARLLGAYAAKDQSLHDAYVIARLIEPSLFESRPMVVAVDWRGSETAGTCHVLPSGEGAGIEVVTGIDVPAVTRLLVRTLSGSASWARS
jgi:purine nucleosidase